MAKGRGRLRKAQIQADIDALSPATKEDQPRNSPHQKSGPSTTLLTPEQISALGRSIDDDPLQTIVTPTSQFAEATLQ